MPVRPWQVGSRAVEQLLQRVRCRSPSCSYKIGNKTSGSGKIEKNVFPRHIPRYPVFHATKRRRRAQTPTLILTLHMHIGDGGWRGEAKGISKRMHMGETWNSLLILKRVLGHGHEDEIARNVRYTRSGSGQLDEILRRKHV